MLSLIILAAQVPCYAYVWRKVFNKAAYWFVVKHRGPKYAPQLEPDWGDVGVALIAATIAACFWLPIFAIVLGQYCLSLTTPMDVTEKLGGKPPAEVRKALLEYTTKQLEHDTGMGYHPEIAAQSQIDGQEILRGDIV